MTAIPPEAVIAAAKALQQVLDPWAFEVGAPLIGDVQAHARDVLEAAAPLIAAAERERIRQFAIEHVRHCEADCLHGWFSDVLGGDR